MFTCIYFSRCKHVVLDDHSFLQKKPSCPWQMPYPKVVFQAIFQSAVRECERTILMDLLQNKSPSSTTEAHKHAVLDSCPRTCATITDTNRIYLLCLNYCNFLDLALKLTHMFSTIPRYFHPIVWTANTPLSPRFSDPIAKQLITVPSYITTHRTDHAHIVTPWWGGHHSDFKLKKRIIYSGIW